MGTSRFFQPRFLSGDLRVCQALSFQEKAVMSSERVQGIDHPWTIRDYVRTVPLSLEDKHVVGPGCGVIVFLPGHTPVSCVSDSPGAVLRCSRPACDLATTAVPRSLPHSAGDWGRSSICHASGCKWDITWVTPHHTLFTMFSNEIFLRILKITDINQVTVNTQDQILVHYMLKPCLKNLLCSFFIRQCWALCCLDWWSTSSPWSSYKMP